MHRLLIVAGLTALPPALLPAIASAQSADAVVAAGKTYRARCQSCHQPPDTQLATDRAWLDQVNRTN